MYITQRCVTFLNQVIFGDPRWWRVQEQATHRVEIGNNEAETDKRNLKTITRWLAPNNSELEMASYEINLYVMLATNLPYERANRSHSSVVNLAYRQNRTPRKPSRHIRSIPLRFDNTTLRTTITATVL